MNAAVHDEKVYAESAVRTSTLPFKLKQALKFIYYYYRTHARARKRDAITPLTDLLKPRVIITIGKPLSDTAAFQVIIRINLLEKLSVVNCFRIRSF